MTAGILEQRSNFYAGRRVFGQKDHLERFLGKAWIFWARNPFLPFLRQSPPRKYPPTSGGARIVLTLPLSSGSNSEGAPEIDAAHTRPRGVKPPSACRVLGVQQFLI
jgi:hypothetical protein